MNLLRYFAGRLLLVGVSFIGIMLVCFFFTQIVPGGPVEQYIASLRGVAGEGGATGSNDVAISPEQIEAVRRIYGMDQPLPVRFWRWLWRDRLGMRAMSLKYTNKTSWEMISERFPVSLSFGIPSLVLTYVICVPLGIAKALKNGKTFDLVSSLIVFVLYAIPAFAAGMLLRMWFSGTVDRYWDIFPLGGFRSQGWEQLGFWEKVKDQAWHMVLPVTCYVMGNFAVMTLLMKNSLLEQISQDYVRTVLAKGARIQRAVWRHAVRNALIPIATGIGGILTIMFAGSVIIESVFNIPGIGWLSLDAIVSRDYPLFLTIVSLQSILGLLGQVLSDLTLVLVDPRIHFGGDR